MTLISTNTDTYKKQYVTYYEKQRVIYHVIASDAR